MTSTVQRLELELVKLKSELESKNLENSATYQPAPYINFLQQTITSLIAQMSPQVPPMFPHMNPPNFVFPRPFMPQQNITGQPTTHTVTQQVPSSLNAQTEQQLPHPNVPVQPTPVPNQPQPQHPLPEPSAATDSSSTQQRDRSKKDIIIVGDSMLNGVQEKGMRRDHFVRVRPHPGATSEDMVDFVLPYARQRPDAIALHVGTNDLTKKSNSNPSIPKERRPVIDSISCMKQVFDLIKKESPNTEIIYSLATPRFDKPDLKGKVNDLNNRMRNLCSSYGIRCIDHKNIDSSCITRPQRYENGRPIGKKGGGIHPNPQGNGRLATNFLDFFETF